MLLTEATLAALPPGIATVSYDRGALTVGMVHFGVGGFHRAHQAMYVDRLMTAGGSTDWGICGVGVMEADRAMRDAMAAQDCLYTLVVKHADGRREARVIGSMIEYLFAPDSPEAVIEKMADPRTRIVSLTITEGGYNFHAVTGEFDEKNPGVARDLESGAPPVTVFGLIIAALERRRERGVEPFTVMSCDNIQGNGNVARRSFSSFAALKSPELGRWVEQTVSFPNSMVDRITPVTTDADRAEIAAEWGLDDRWPVVCEPFTQWVLEDAFPGGRPALEEVGVQVVTDVEPYELMKLRLLNAAHQGLCYFGALAGFEFVHDVCADDRFVAFLMHYMDEEATPTLAPVPGIDLDVYKRTLIERFSNPHVRDTVARLCAETSDRIPKFVLPVIDINLAAGRSVTLGAAIVASWARYCEGTDDAGRRIVVVDRLSDSLMSAARRQDSEPLAFLGNRDLFGDLVDDPRFVAAYDSTLSSLHRDGALATLTALTAPAAG